MDKKELTTPETREARLLAKRRWLERVEGLKGNALVEAMKEAEKRL